MEKIITGIDIGGTHITVCQVDIEDGLLLKNTHTRHPVIPTVDKNKIIRSWCDAIVASHAVSMSPVKKLGIAMPGPFDYEKGISYIQGLHKYESLYGLNVKDLLAKELGIYVADIRMVNDASAYLLGEKFAGAAKDYDKVIGITLGTGLGSAVYHNNQLHEGDLFCTDFMNGKCEDFASARWILFEYEKISGDRLPNVKAVADRCAIDEHARTVFRGLGKNIANILQHRYADLSPCTVVIGGNIARAWDHFVPFAEEQMQKNNCQFSLIPALLGEDAALSGAAYLWGY